MIRQLDARDAGPFFELRRASLLEAPLAFTASPDDDLASSLEATREMLQRGPDSVVLGHFAPELAGVIGLYRDRHLKCAHRAYIWGMYVTPGRRREGIGAALLEAAIRHARALPGLDWLLLCVSTAAPEAQRLYERAGFRTWGRQPDALRHAGRSAGENHLVLRLATG